MNLLERRRAMISALAKSPSLVFLEYIESTGTQYIDTRVSPTINTGIRISYAYPTRSSSANAGVCGTYQSQTPRSDTLFVSSQTGKTASRPLVCHRGSVLIDADQEIIANNGYIAEVNFLNNGNIKVGNATDTQGSNAIETHNLLLFARYNAQNGTIAVSESKIYSFEVSEGSSLIRNFVPCKKGDEVGLYDLVNHKFYGNDGTGSFIAGPDLT